MLFFFCHCLVVGFPLSLYLFLLLSLFKEQKLNRHGVMCKVKCFSVLKNRNRKEKGLNC